MGLIICRFDSPWMGPAKTEWSNDVRDLDEQKYGNTFATTSLFACTNPRIWTPNGHTFSVYSLFPFLCFGRILIFIKDITLMDSSPWVHFGISQRKQPDSRICSQESQIHYLHWMATSECLCIKNIFRPWDSRVSVDKVVRHYCTACSQRCGNWSKEKWSRKCNYNCGWRSRGILTCETRYHGIGIEKASWLYQNGNWERISSRSNFIIRRERFIPRRKILTIDLFQQAVKSPTSRLYKFQEGIKKLTGFTTPVVWARGVFNYDFGLMPWRHEINTVGSFPSLYTLAQTCL